MFKTELHCHSSDISDCARVDADCIIKKYTEAGYSSLVLANHFNTFTLNRWGAKSWEEFVRMYVGAYEKLKEKASGKLNILLGMELRFDMNVNDYLVFGVSEEFLLNNPGILTMNPESFHKLCKENGLLFIQAHPFRNSMTVVRPDCLDGIEVFNGHKGHDSRNDIARIWAEKFNLIMTSGTDFHYDYAPANAGIITDEEITSMEHLIGILKSSSYTLIQD